MAAKLPTAQPALADFLGLLVGVPNTTTLLNGAHDSAVTTITVDAVPTGAPTAGAVFIDNECITYTGKTATTITGCTRGAQDTTAASHSDDATVRWGLTKGTINQLIEELIQMSKTGAGAKGADVASAAALNIGEDGHYFHVTGTTTITSIETRLSGQIVVLEFDGALTLTHNATSLILRGAANVTTAAGDIFWFASEGSGNWREIARCTTSSIGGTRTRSVFIPATAFGVVNGTPALTGRTWYVPYAMDAAAIESVGTQWAVPEDYASGALTVKIWWTNAASSSGNVVWKIYLGATASGEDLNSPPTNASASDLIAAPTTNDVLAISGHSSSITPSAGEILGIAVERTGNHVNDTLANDAWFVGLEIEYTAND